MKFFIIIKEKSERVPNKNFIEIGGIPLWQHLINELKGEQVYIDTDSNKIIESCNDLKWVNAYFRTKEHIDYETNDKLNRSPVLKMIERFIDEHVLEDEIIVTPHVTSPFIRLETIKDASLYLNKYESVQACVSIKEFAYFRNKPINFNPNIVPKTQDLEPVYIGNGAFFIFRKSTFLKYKNRTSPNTFFYPLSFKESIEIDYKEDLKLAKLIYENY